MNTAPVVAIAVDRHPASEIPGTLSLQHAYFGFTLHAVAPASILERLNERTTLLTRLQGALTDLPGASRAIEVRCVVWPATAANDWHEHIHCYLLARLSTWDCAQHEHRARAAEFAHHLGHILAHTLPGSTFLPLTCAADLARAREPFALEETGEVRRHLPGAGAVLPLPFRGVPDVEAAVEMMARQPHPSLLAVCVQPTALSDPILAASEEEPKTMGPDLAVGAVRRRTVPGERWIAGSLARVSGDVADWERQALRVAMLRQRAFQLRVQLASPAPLGAALIATILGEVGGPGLHTAQSVWQDPALPVAAGAVWERPRSSRPRGAPQTEVEVARTNLRHMLFIPWGPGSESRPCAERVYLADVSEVARLLPLPGAAPWLPGRGHALALPLVAGAADGLRLGNNPVRGIPRPVVLPDASRAQHLWILGKPGTGKSTLLESLILQDIRAGRGAIVIDPHGDLIHEILGKIPVRRARDVILFDPSDTSYPVGINPLEAETEAEKALVVSSFLGLLKKLYDPNEQGIVGPRFEHGVRNGMLTVMSRPGSTLVEFVRVLTDDQYLRALLPHVTDPIVRRYWTDQIARTSDFHRSEVLDYTVSKFGRWVTDPTIRRIVGQSRSSFSFREAMDSGKIVLLSLAKGRLGGDDANFLGLILLPKILQAALSRVDLPPHERRDVAVYIDEFHNYATDVLALMLAEARKYHVGLVLANQHIEQLTPDIRSAVIGNAGSIVAFRLGLKDAAAMEEILAPSPVTAHHLGGLPNYTAYARLLVGGEPTPTFTLATEPVTLRRDERRAERIRTGSRQRYGRPVAQVDAEMSCRASLEPQEPSAQRHRRLDLVVQ